MVDLNALAEMAATPISDDAPTGENARYEDAYEGASEEVGKLESLAGEIPDWGRVAELSATVLKDHSKDLMAAAWLAGGLWETQQYAGLRRGLDVMRIIMRDYWDGAFPTRLRARRSAVTWILDRAITWLESGDIKPTRDDLVELVDIMGEMYSSTEDQWDGDDPPIWQLQKRYQTELDGMPAPAAEPEMPAPGDEMPAPGDAMPAPAGAPVVVAGAPSVSVGGISNRQEAFQALATVAKFVETTEPHSPIVPLLRRAIAWSELSFEEIYTQLLRRHPGSMAYMWDTLGLGLDEVPGGEASLVLPDGTTPAPPPPTPAQAAAAPESTPAPTAMPSPSAPAPAPSPAPADDDDGMPAPTMLG